MSDYEHHEGKIRKVHPFVGESFAQMIERIAVSDGCTDGNYDEYFRDELDGQYLKTKTELWEIFDHVDKGDTDMFCRLSLNSDGSFSFVTRFYNGGTYLAEMLEDEIAELNKGEGE